jgi:hypothetical protein
MMRYAATIQRQYTALLKELAEIQKSRALRNDPEPAKKAVKNQPPARQPESPLQPPDKPVTVVMHPAPPPDAPLAQPNM